MLTNEPKEISNECTTSVFLFWETPKIQLCRPVKKKFTFLFTSIQIVLSHARVFETNQLFKQTYVVALVLSKLIVCLQFAGFRSISEYRFPHLVQCI